MEGTGNAYQSGLLAREVTAAARHGRCRRWNLCAHSGGTASNRAALLCCRCLIWLHTSESRGEGGKGSSSRTLWAPMRKARGARSCGLSAGLRAGSPWNYRSTARRARHEPLGDKKRLAFPSANHTPHSNLGWREAALDLKGNRSVQRDGSQGRRVWSGSVNIPHTHRDTSSPILVGVTFFQLSTNHAFYHLAF